MVPRLLCLPQRPAAPLPAHRLRPPQLQPHLRHPPPPPGVRPPLPAAAGPHRRLHHPHPLQGAQKDPHGKGLSPTTRDEGNQGGCCFGCCSLTLSHLSLRSCPWTAARCPRRSARPGCGGSSPASCGPSRRRPWRSWTWRNTRNFGRSEAPIWGHPPPPPRLPAKRWLMDTATEINRRAILLRIYSGVSGGFASFHDCFGRLRAARPFTPLPSLPPYCGGTARRPSRSGGSARGGAAARGPRGPERCVPGEGPGWAGGGGSRVGPFSPPTPL